MRRSRPHKLYFGDYYGMDEEKISRKGLVGNCAKGDMVVFSSPSGRGFEQTITHEWLHLLIERLVNRRASKQFDKVCDKYKELR